MYGIDPAPPSKPATPSTRTTTPSKPWYAGENDLPPPKQPTITFTTQQFFNYAHWLINKHEYVQLHHLLNQVVLMRRAIMNFWDAKNEEIDAKFLDTLPRCNMREPEFVLPSHFSATIVLPTTSQKFNNYSWAIISRTMFPGLTPIDFTTESLNVFAWTFNEFMASTKTASRSIVLDGLISEERVKLNKRIHNRNSPEYAAELSAIRLRHGDELRNKMKELRTYYKEYARRITEGATNESVNPVTHPEMRKVWERITFNPIICGIDPYVASLIDTTKPVRQHHLLFIEFVHLHTLDEYMNLIKALRNKFYSEYPNYTNTDMYDIDEASPEITKIYEAKASVVQAQLDREEEARVAAAIAKRKAEDEEWYRTHPNWEEEEEEWNEPVDGPEHDEPDPCEYRNQYIPMEVDAKLKAEAREEYITLHAEEIAKRHAEHEEIYNKWCIVNKYIEILIGVANFKMQLEDLEASNIPLDDSKVDYNVDPYDSSKRQDSHEVQMEKSRYSLALNFYSLVDSVMDACAEPFKPYPKLERFNDPVRSQYTRLHLESIDGPARIQMSFNSVDPANIRTLTFLFKSLYDIESILPKCIVSAVAASGSESMANTVALFIKSLTSNYNRVTELMLQPKIGTETIPRNRNYWFLFWSLYFLDVIVIDPSPEPVEEEEEEEEEAADEAETEAEVPAEVPEVTEPPLPEYVKRPKALIASLFTQCGNANNQGACFVTFRLVLAFNKANNFNDHARFDMIKKVIYANGTVSLHTFKLDNYYAVIDALELIDPAGLTQYRKDNNLK